MDFGGHSPAAPDPSGSPTPYAPNFFLVDSYYAFVLLGSIMYCSSPKVPVLSEVYNKQSYDLTVNIPSSGNYTLIVANFVRGSSVVVTLDAVQEQQTQVTTMQYSTLWTTMTYSSNLVYTTTIVYTESTTAQTATRTSSTHRTIFAQVQQANDIPILVALMVIIVALVALVFFMRRKKVVPPTPVQRPTIVPPSTTVQHHTPVPTEVTYQPTPKTVPSSPAPIASTKFCGRCGS